MSTSFYKVIGNTTWRRGWCLLPILLFLWCPLHGEGIAVMADPQDPYYPLAREIAAAEGAKLIHFPERTIPRETPFVLWVVSPQGLGIASLQEAWDLRGSDGSAVSLGIITGGTLERARALWQRKESPSGKYLSFHGEGSAFYWTMPDGKDLNYQDIPAFRYSFVYAPTLKTLGSGRDYTLAVQFLDQGALGFVGFGVPPRGFCPGGAAGGSYIYSHPDFPLGHMVQIHNRGLGKGIMNRPLQFLLGDPRSFLGEAIPYSLTADYNQEGERHIRLVGLPEGSIPLKIAGGAGYSYVEVSGGSKGWRDEPFFNPRLQMVDIGEDKFLLYSGGEEEISLRLKTNPPASIPLPPP